MIKVNGRAKYTEEDLGFICFYKATDSQSKAYLRLQRLRRLQKIGVCFILLFTPILIEIVFKGIFEYKLLMMYSFTVSLFLFNEFSIFLRERKLWKQGKIYYHDCEVISKDGLDEDLSTEIVNGNLLYRLSFRDKDTGYISTVYLHYNDYRSIKGDTVRCWYIFDISDELPILFS